MLAYVAELKKLATHCNFGVNLNKALRDKLVCGLQNMQIQRRLLSEAKLKYSKALEIAIAMETAVRDASELHSELHAEPRVDKISNNSNHHHCCRTSRLRVAIDVEKTRTHHIIADSRTRHVIIVGRWAIFPEFVTRDNKVSQSNHLKHHKTLNSILFSTVKVMNLKMC